MIPEVEPYNNWAGDGTTTQFDFDFYIEDSSQLNVEYINSSGTRTALTNDVDYTINEIGSESGSYITYPKSGSSHGVLQAGEVISLQLTLPISQESEYGKSSDLDLKSLEFSFDYLTRLIQIYARQLERAVKVQEGSDIDTDELTQDLIIVADNIADVNTVSGHIDNVDTVNNHISNVDTVAGSIANVNKTGTDIANVNTVAGSISNVNTVATNISSVNTVAGSITNVNKVGTDISKVNTVAGDIANVNTVAGDKTNIDTVANDKTNIDAVAGSISNVNTVAGSIANVNTVAGDKENIDAVAGDKENIDTCADNIASINAAPTYAQTASDSADACIAALSEAESLRNSLRLFSNINAGTLSDTRSLYINGGTLSDTRSLYHNAGSLSDWRIAGDDIKNILNLPLLYKQADDTDAELAAAENRIAQNESDIADINDHLALNDADIDSLEDRATECEGDIDDLEDAMGDANDEIASAKDRITQNENDIAYLEYKTDLFNIINAGKLSDTRSNYINAGTISSTRSNYINASNLSSLTVSKDNLRTIGLVPYLRAEVESLKEQLKTALDFISSIKGGIDCGTLVK